MSHINSLLIIENNCKQFIENDDIDGGWAIIKAYYLVRT
jgi:hypothetical protein